MARSKPPQNFEMLRARGHKWMKQRMRHLSDISTEFIDRFSHVTPLHFFEIMEQTDVNFRAYIFFVKESDIAECEANGTNEIMRTFIYQKLEEYGRGNRDEITVDFVFDSFEHVQRDFEGNYFLRLRQR